MFDTNQDDVWWLEQLETDDDDDDADSNLLRTMPELRQHAAALFDEEQVGLRSLLDAPEVQSKAWRRSSSRLTGAGM